MRVARKAALVACAARQRCRGRRDSSRGRGSDVHATDAPGRRSRTLMDGERTEAGVSCRSLEDAPPRGLAEGGVIARS